MSLTAIEPILCKIIKFTLFYLLYIKKNVKVATMQTPKISRLWRNKNWGLNRTRGQYMTKIKFEEGLSPGDDLHKGLKQTEQKYG